MEKFKGNSILSIGSILFFGINLYGIYYTIYNEVQITFKGVLLLVLLELTIFFISGVSMYYFCLDKEKIIIRNSWYFWYKKELNLYNIESIKFKSRMKVGTTLYIKDGSGKIHSFPCESISSVQFKNLYETINKNGIDVQSEVNF